MLRRLTLALGLGLATALAAQAEPVDEDTARKALFGIRGYTLEFIDTSGLTEADNAWIDALTEQLRKGNQVELSYYGAVAVSPSLFEVGALQRPPLIVQGLMQFTNGANTPGGAQRVARDLCNAARQSGNAPCVVAALVLPRRFGEQPVYLSARATEAFRDYRRLDAPKAFAASPTSASYGMASGSSAVSQALAICGEKGAGDCEIVVQD
jgi:hypothetical protein